MDPTMLHTLQTLLALSSMPMPPHSSDVTSRRPIDNIGTFSNSEAGPPMSASSNSMLTTSNDPTLPHLLSDYALISSGSGGSSQFSYGPSENHFAFDLSADQTPLAMDQLSPATTDSGDVAGSTQIARPPSQSRGHYQLSDAGWQGLTPGSEYSPPNPWLWDVVGYYQPTDIDMPTAPFIPESQSLPDALSLDVNVPSQAQLFQLPPLPSSSTSINPQYHCFNDLDGVRWYQCTVCGKCIKQRMSNFRDHFETHDLHRARFKCDWPGCERLPFTRDRDRKRHIKEDHLGTRTKRCTKDHHIQSATSRRNNRQRKTDI